VATDLRGSDNFNASQFNPSYFLNLTVKKKYEKWSTFDKIVVNVKMVCFF